MKVTDLKLLPAEYRCNMCGLTKPIAEMVIVRRRRERDYYLKSRCKQCHNERERGHCREYKRKYLQRWRRENAAVNESYWNNEHAREQSRINAARRLENREYHDAVLIQRCLNKRGMGVSIQEAKELLKRFGPCYPSRLGLTRKGLRECERIRSRLRQRGSKRLSRFEIRLMVYEDGLYIKPERQPKAYQTAAKTLREWWGKRRDGSDQSSSEAA